jgi:undecaprenyl-diphosphatase
LSLPKSRVDTDYWWRGRAFYVLVGLAGLLAWGFASVADEVMEGGTKPFDDAVTALFRELGHPTDPWGPVWLEEAVRDITALGSVSVLALVVIASVVYLLFAGKPRTAVFVATSVVGGTVLSTALKAGFNRPRPDVEAVARVFTSSFPSGHAMLSAVTYLTLGLLLAESSPSRYLKAYCFDLGISLALLVRISRIYIGVHFPTDVVAGWCVGGAWALLCWAAYSLVFRSGSGTKTHAAGRTP